ncbi:GGDEF domain-containing protein [Acidovorax sp. Root402]|uniref:GGDEF domain-containing protein n=1 Tax=Acidovorax sp. Root402 TaxID=1736527 RepID=UPI001F3A6B7E|nr:GGDEF domain-containing protein [Acidovorax sp. Root402]
MNRMDSNQRPWEWGKALAATWPTAEQVQRWKLWLRSLQVKWAQDPSPQRGRLWMAPPSHANQRPGEPSVSTCVAAMQQMLQVMASEAAERHALERTMEGTQAALTQALADLDRVRNGERLARHQALHDELTNLPNRRHLLLRLEDLLDQRHSLQPGPTVLFIDLDNFKTVNDTHGHGVGDEVLRITAARLNAAVRHGDLVVRLGGDEFACLLRGVADETPLHQLCAKLLQAVCCPMKIGHLQLLVRPSIGVAICPQHGTQADALLACADAAMYAAKRERCGYAFGTASKTLSTNNADRSKPPA